MKENAFDDAAAFDRLEDLVARGVDPRDPAAVDLADELRVIHLLAQTAAPARMPDEVRFREELMGKLRPKQHRFWPTVLALAAAVVVGFLVVSGDAPEIALDLSDQQVASALETRTREDMVAYLDHTERLLMAIRDHEEACSDETNDMGLERQEAQELLMTQKRFASVLEDSRYRQARQLFSNLETILVDLKNLDPCTDPVDLELINDHVTNKRILGKLRLIAQEIQVS